MGKWAGRTAETRRALEPCRDHGTTERSTALHDRPSLIMV